MLAHKEFLQQSTHRAKLKSIQKGFIGFCLKFIATLLISFLKANAMSDFFVRIANPYFCKYPSVRLSEAHGQAETCKGALGARSRARTWKTTLRPRGPHALSGQGYAFLVYSNNIFAKVY